MLRRILATALVLGVCLAVTGCEKDESTTNGTTAPVQDPEGNTVTPEGPGEGMTIEDPPTGDGQ